MSSNPSYNNIRQLQAAVNSISGLALLADIATQQRRAREREPFPTANRSTIACGYDDDGDRKYTKYIDIFGDHVAVFSAVNDPERRLLVRASDVARLLNITTSSMAMWIMRRRHWSGIYQANDFIFKRAGRHGLKKNGYYITLDNVQILSANRV